MDALLRRRAMIAAGGSPTPPPTPTGVVFYDRLVFDGTAYIDTDIIPDSEATYRMMFGDETLKASQTLFTIPAENSTRIGVVYGSATTSTKRVFSVYYGNTGAVRTGDELNFSSGRYTMMLSPIKFQYGQHAAASITKGSNAPSGALIIGQNATHSGQAYTGTVGNLRLYGPDAKNATNHTDLLNNYTPTHTLRPCTYYGEAGLWCVETSKFYGNSAASGALSVINNS